MSASGPPSDREPEAADQARGGDQGVEQRIVDKPGRTLGSHTAILAIGNLANRGLSFLLLPVYMGILPPQAYGLVELALPAGQILQRIVGQGLGTALFRAFSLEARGEQERLDLIATTIRYALATTAVGFALAAALAPSLGRLVYESSPGTLFLLLAFAYGCLRNIATLGQQILRARLRTKALIVLNTVEFLTNLGFNLLFVVAWRWGPIGILWSHLIGGSLGVILTLALVPEVFRGRFRRPLLPGLLRFGLPMVPGSIALYLMNYLDRYFLEEWVSTVEVGLYGIAAKFANVLEIALLSPFAMVWPAIYFPLARQKDGAVRLGSLFGSLLAIGLLGSLATTFFAPAIIALCEPDDVAWLGDSPRKYWEAGEIVGLLSLAVIAAGIREMVKIPINISGCSRYLPPINIIGIGYCALLNWLLIPRYGMVGAAAGTVLAYLAVDATLWLVGRRLYPIPLPVGRIVPVLVAFAALFLWAWYGWRDYGLGTLALRAVGLVGFAGLLLGTGLLDRGAILAMIRQRTRA